MDGTPSEPRTREQHRPLLQSIRTGLPARIRSIPAGCWLAVIVLADVLLALTVRIPSLFATDALDGFSERYWALDIALLSVVPVVVFAAVQLTRRRQRELAAASESSDVIDTVMRTSREWLWAVDGTGSFSFSSPICEQLTGYTPAELVGSPFGLVLDPEDLATALKSQPGSAKGSEFAGLVLVCRHRAGHRVLIEVTGNAIHGAPGFEGTARPVDDPSSSERAAEHVRERITALVPGDSLVTAFQPIHCLGTGNIIGAEALSRFPHTGSTSTEAWFMRAASIGMEAELELLALRTALDAAQKLPLDIYLAVNLSPRVCLDPRVLETLSQGSIHPSRLVLEVTERQEVENYEDLVRLLAPLRTSGMRLAIDDAGAGYASMRHIIRLKPDLIKLDRAIIRDIDTESSHRALGAAMVGFAAETGALVVAEGIETAAELNAVTTLGMAAGQGYLLGKPTLKHSDWEQWGNVGNPARGSSAPAGTGQ